MSAELLNIYAPLPQVKRGEPFFPGYDPKSGNIVYACGNAIVIRNVENPLVADMYYEHSCATTVAKYSPSGFYIASGDVQGNIRIWDTTQKEHPLKIELRVLSGPISDIAWSGDSQRVVVCGDGKERFGAVFVWDAGSSVGEISGHSKRLVSCGMRADRPFRVATGGEDMQINWFEGPPFKFKKSMRDNTRMVTCVRFSPDSARLATCATDKKVVVYDGKTGDKTGEVEGHKGGVYGVSWSPDSTRFVTVSADKSAAVWDAAGLKEVGRHQFGAPKPATSDQQLGCVWAGGSILSFNMEGEIAYLKPDALGEGPQQVLTGHSKAITALVCAGDGASFFTGSYDGRVVRWDAASGKNQLVGGSGHTNQVADMGLLEGSKTLVSCAMDNTVRFTSLETLTYGESVDLGSPVAGISVLPSSSDELVVAAAMEAVVVLKGRKVVFTLPVKYCATCVSLAPDGKEVAVGGKSDKALHIYTLGADGSLAEKAVLTSGFRGELTDVAYSPDGRLLATADAARNIFVWNAASHELMIEGWVFHTARVTTLAWSPDSKHVASGAVDSSLYVWSVDTPDKRITIKSAHPSGTNKVAWLNATTLLSAAQDCSAKSWKISF